MIRDDIVRHFAERHRLPPDAIRADGEVMLTIDGKYRVRIASAPHQRVALHAKLMSLAGRRADDADETLVELASVGCGLLKDHASTLALDAERDWLVLQQLVPANGDATMLETALADFVNALAFWTKLCAEQEMQLDKLEGDRR
jgi:hypothetical protein